METIKALYISATPTCAAPSGVRAQPLSQTHLTRRSRAALRRFAADNPAHRRIVAQALSVVHVLVSGKATKYRLPEQPGQCVPTILATACVGHNITRHLGQTECVVEFAISQQPSIGGHQGAAKLEHQAAVEIQPNSIRSRFTPWVRHGLPRSIQGKMLIAISESRRPRRNSVRYPVNAGLYQTAESLTHLRQRRRSSAVPISHWTTVRFCN